MLDSFDNIQPADKQRGVLTDALNKAIEAFCSHSKVSFDDVMSAGLRPIASALDINRVMVFRYQDCDDGNKGMVMTYLWDRSYEGGKSAPIDEKFAVLPNAPQINEWAETLMSGSNINLSIDNMLAADLPFMEWLSVKSLFMSPIFTNGEFWGVVAFVDRFNIQCLGCGSEDLMTSAARLCANAIIRQELNENAQIFINTQLRHEQYKDALSNTAITLLSQKEKSFEEMIISGISQLADTIGIDGLSVWRNYSAPDGMYSKAIFNWDKELGGQLYPPQLADFAHNKYTSNWELYLSRGIAINGPVRTMHEQEAALLKSYGLASILIAPIFTDDHFWGLVLFGDNRNERYFDQESVELMSQAAFLFANAFIRAELEQNVIDAEERVKLMLDSSPICCQLWDENMNVVDCNEAAVKLYGLSSKKEYTERFFEFSPEFQPDGQKSVEKAISLLNKALSEGSITFPWLHQMPDGTPLPAEVTLARVSYGDGFIVAGYTRDLRAEVEAEERVQLMLDSSPICCQLWDTNMNVVDCNEAAVKLYDLSGKQEYLDRFFEFMPEFQPDGQKSKEKAIVFINKALSEGSVTFPWMHQLSDGTPLPAEVTLARVRYGDSFVVAGYTRDLRAEVDAEERVRLMLDSSPICCQLWDENMKIVDCNEAAVKLYGLSGKQEYLDRFFEFMPEFQPDGQTSSVKVKMFMDQALSEGSAVFPWMYQLPDGTPLPAEVTLARVSYGDNMVVAGYTRDLRIHSKMMEELEKQDHLLHTVNTITSKLLEADPLSFDEHMNMSMGMLAEAADVDRVYIWKNSENENKLLASQLYEWSGNAAASGGDDMVDIPYAELMPELGEHLPNGRSVNGLLRNMSPQLQSLLEPLGIHSILVVPVFYHEQFWGFVGFDDCRRERIFTKDEEMVLLSASRIIVTALIRQTTERELRETGEQLAAALKTAEDANNAKSEFLSHMSHEMRTPMNAIKGMTAIAKNADDPLRKDYALNKVEEACMHLIGIINDILDMSKIDANMLVLAHDPFDLRDVMQKAASLIHFPMTEKRLKFTMHMPNDTPSRFFGDDQRLTQILTNLLSNAVKFTPESGNVSMTVDLLEECDGICTMRFEVADNGIGIAPDQHEKIFKAFEQADTGTTRRFGGTGLGLVISKRIVSLMGGTISVESEVDRGSKFTFVINLECDYEILTPSEPDTEKMPDLTIEAKFKGKRVLIAEDIDINREILIALLEDTGLKLDIAVNGKEALDIVTAMPGKYDLILMDIQMPEMDGLEATRRIRQLVGSRLPIIAMTANVFMDDINACLAAGMDDHLGKPLDMEDVIDKLIKYL
ncbi:MAG: ATP-binding protein [Defluviitaleaceae bacterium]|nr:ATP-binding protein [Defluviitaleaceae bacterium]MCL2837205.1 ATP-binding protein [Defluviitaleaceae bacterium]